ncbi:hypothetical protein J6590_073503 [Homalodisca vitripennis]|nr:hypothetical protein J6590_073503 [Homalodisca vitripennis]
MRQPKFDTRSMSSWSNSTGRRTVNLIGDSNFLQGHEQLWPKLFYPHRAGKIFKQKLRAIEIYTQLTITKKYNKAKSLILSCNKIALKE